MGAASGSMVDNGRSVWQHGLLTVGWWSWTPEERNHRLYGLLAWRVIGSNSREKHVGLVAFVVCSRRGFVECRNRSTTAGQRHVRELAERTCIEGDDMQQR